MKRKIQKIKMSHMPQPRRGKRGASILGPRNLRREVENRDIIASPSTDARTLPNLKWSFADSHMRLEDGGWARQTTIRELPVATELAGVNMRLKPGAIRELHWHKQAGDVGYVPIHLPHYVENTGKTTMRFLEISNCSRLSAE